MRISSIVALLLVLAVTAACASAGKKRGEPCALRSRDSTYLAGGPVYRDCSVDRPAKQVGILHHPDWRPPARTGCYFAEVDFVVDENGRPERGTENVMRANDQSLAAAIIAMLPEWTFEPAMLGGQPVRQVINNRQTVQTGTVVVPAGQSPPTRPPTAGHQPQC